MGTEYSGEETLELNDINNWVVEGPGGEAAKGTLDDFEWNGEAVMGLTLITSTDNKKVSNAMVFLTGEFMKSSKDIKANRLFPEADKDLKIQYCIEEASTFSFRTGSMVGEALDDDKVTWTVLRKSARGYTAVEEADYVEQKIGHFSIKPYVVPISATRAKVTLLVFPLSTEELESQHSHWRKTSFPGLELMQTEVDMFPVVTGETGKRWGLPPGATPTAGRKCGGAPLHSNHRGNKAC